MLLRIISLCIVLASAETLHGIARAALIAPRIGKDRAVKVSAITGSLLALAICYFLVPGIGLSKPSELLALGLVLAAFMAIFDIALGVLLLRKPWRKIVNDFNPKTGNWLLFGLIALVFIPMLAMALQPE